ncbi:WD40 repeat-like protein [Martensiomyces pterosporus]|nr:WD40 repeat-like protein [Martensiomyces pterosporus]
MHSLVAATSDCVRVWDISASGSKQQKTASYTRPRRGSSSASTSSSFAANEDSEHVQIFQNSSYTADCAGTAVDEIKSVSWAAGGSTFVVGGHGTAIRQYSRTGEPLQDIKLTRRSEKPGPMDVVAVQHYGPNSEVMFVANNTTRQVRRWDFVRREYTAVCQTHENDISCMAVNAKKRAIATATSRGGEIALFNLLHNTRTDLRSATQKALTCIDISPIHRSQIAVGSEDGLLQLFDTSRSGMAPLKTFLHVHSAPIRSLAFHPINSTLAVSAGLDSRIIVTDTNAYNPSALSITAQSPLTCLACCHEPYIVGAGTIDGDAVIYDLRGPSVPLWKESVDARRSVVGISFTQPSAGNGGAPSYPLRRSASSLSSSREPRTSTRDGAHSRNGSSDERTSSTSLAERRRARGSTVASVGLAPAAASTKGANDASLRPPHHPSISKFRASVNEYQLSSGSNASSKASAPSHLQTHRQTAASSIFSQPESKAPPSSAAPAADEDMENNSILVKDRSYMDLLSPAKPTQTPGVRGHSSSETTVRNSIAAGTLPLPLLSRLDSSGTTEGSHRTPDNGEVAQDKDFNRNNILEGLGHSPPLRLHGSSNDHKLAQPHDIGDSMMEMFTPERDQKSKAWYQGPESKQHAVESPSRLASNLLMHLRNKHKSAGLGMGTSPEKDEEEEHKEEARASVSPVSMPAFAQEANASQPSPPSAHRPALERPKPRAAQGTSSHQQSQDPLTCTHSQQPQHLPSSATITSAAAAGQSDTNSTHEPSIGLGSVSSSVLQNLLVDALAPLREQIRGEIRNMHLDMIRQNFVFQEQIMALREECSQTRALRQEIEHLRQENDRLRRYIPFHNMLDDDTTTSGQHTDFRRQ